MKKNDLIQLLQNIEGNPEVLIWNGFTSDWMHISKKVKPSKLYKRDHKILAESLKESPKYRHLTEEQCSSLAKHIADKDGYDDINKIPLPDNEIKRDFKSKKVVILQAKPRGKTLSDRNGKLIY